MKSKLLEKLSDVTKLHKRAAFADVEKITTNMGSDFLKLANERYSCRKFTDAKVAEVDLMALLEAGRRAPSAVNNQPVHIWVLETPEALAKVKEATAYSFDAPLVIVVCARPSEAWVRKYDGKNGAEIDAAIVGTHIMLEATSRGLGTTWVGSFDPAKMLELFPEMKDDVPVVMFPIGHPDEGPSHRHDERKSLEELVSRL